MKLRKKIAMLMKNPEFIYQTGKHKGKPKVSAMSRELGYPKNTVLYNINDNYRRIQLERFSKNYEKNKEKKTTPEYWIKRIPKNKNPNSICNKEYLKEFLSILLDDSKVDELIDLMR